MLKAMNEKPNIVNFIDERASEKLHLVLRGHLYLEYLLNEIVDKKTDNPTALQSLNFGFYKKVKYLLAIGVIDDQFSELLLFFNSIRNSYAHKLHYDLDFDVVFELVSKASAAGVDFSDETIFQDRALSKEWYGTFGVLHEVISNTFQDLVWQNEDIFTQDEISEFLG